MNIREFEERAEAVFGPKWRTELPQHYGITSRAVTYWRSGVSDVPSHVKSDLMAWTRPNGQGRIAFMLAQVRRSFSERIAPDFAVEACEALGDWLSNRLDEAKRYDRLRAQEEARRSDYIMRAEFEADIRIEERMHAWMDRQPSAPEWEQDQPPAPTWEDIAARDF